MKKLISFLLVAILAVPAFAQSLDKLLKEYFDAVGQDKLVKIESIKATGNIVQMGIEIPFIMYNKRPNSYRTEGTFQGMTFIQAYNGTDGYTINPFSGSTEPQPLSPDELKSMKVQADIDGVLWNYKEKGNKVSLEADQDVEGTPCYTIKIITSDSDQYLYYIDKESYMSIKNSSIVKVQGADVESDTYMSNFLKVDGVVLPGKIESRYQGETTMVININSYELNTKLDDSLFGPPTK
ncbi:MAG: hypothetical protein WAU21_10375 [Chitinophagales bacterium]|nr:hypothetical protein [Bacteroidota bacterium]